MLIGETPFELQILKASDICVVLFRKPGLIITVTSGISLLAGQGQTSNLNPAVSHMCNEEIGMNSCSTNNTSLPVTL